MQRRGGIMHGAIMIRWGTSVPGRESASLAVFDKAINRFEALTKEGRIHGHHEYVSVTGRDGGFALLEGELAELTTILGEEDTVRLNSQASAIVGDFEIQTFVGGTDQSIDEMVGTYRSSLHEIGYM
jgi:hypothetical protein